jgi:shikimate dehydrogenase
MIDGQTQLVGVMGWPVAHSLSPAMHNAAFEALGLNWRYVPLAVRPDQVGGAVEGLKALGFRGANVTVPHKESVVPYLDQLPPQVRRFGAVNTIVIDRSQEPRCTLTGQNTDVQGFILALQEGGFDPAGRRVLVVGAGGGARGVVAALCGAGAASVAVLNRTPVRAAALVADLSACAGGARLVAHALTPEALERHAADADLLVNATTAGMWPHVNASIWPADLPLPSHLAVCDLVYRPLETQLLRRAHAAGALCIDGLSMLIWQGALSFEMWTGRRAPVAAMRAACQAALEGEIHG